MHRLKAVPLNSEIETLMKLTSHKNPKQSIAVLLESLVREELRREQKKRREKIKTEKASGPLEPSSDVETGTHHATGRTKKVQSELKEEKEKTAANNIFSTEVKRTVWTRAKGKCEFPNCESSYQLEFDHIQAKTLGGTNELENCRLLCRSHNIFVATQVFGREQMGKFVSGVRQHT